MSLPRSSVDLEDQLPIGQANYPPGSIAQPIR